MCNCHENKKHCCSCNKKKESRGVDMSLIQEWDNFIGQQDPAQFGNSFALERGRGGIPPDNSLAVSSSKIIAMTNQVISLSEKDTLQEYFRMSLTEFYGLTLEDPGPFDPWVMYEEFSNRFFVLSIVDTVNEDGSFNDFKRRFVLAVSKDSSPKSINDFYQYTWVSPRMAAASLDYPKMAIDKDAVYITSQEGNFDTFFWEFPVVVFRKQSLIDGTSPYNMTPIFLDYIIGGFAFGNVSTSNFVFPLQPHKSSCGVEKVLLVANHYEEEGSPLITGNKLRIYNVKNVLTSPTLETFDVNVPSYSYDTLNSTIPQPPPTSNPDNQPILGIDSRQFINTGLIRGKSLWTIHCVMSEDGEGRKLARWYEIDISNYLSNVATLKQSGTIDPGNRVQTGSFPSIAVDKCGNAAFNLNLIGETQYPAIGYTVRLKNDPPGTVRMPIQRAADPNLYYQVAISSNRYGDYTRIVVDPSDQKTFHLFGQRPYPADPSFEQTNDGYKIFNFGTQWTTYMGVFQAKKCGKGINAPQKTVPTAAPVSVSTRSVRKTSDAAKLTEFRLKKKEKYIKKINKIQDETLKKKLLDKIEKIYKDKFNL